MTTTHAMSAAEPLTEENERELVALARRYEAVGRLLRQRDDLHRIIREYVGEVESGEKFDALVSSVPGLVSDDGVYGAFEPGPVVVEWRAALGLTGGA